MSGYRGRTGPNFSEYLNNLNNLTSPYDQEFPAEDIDLSQDLAMFTNTDFTHFDIPSLPEESQFGFDLNSGKVDNNVKFEELLSNTQSTNTFHSAPLDSTSNDTAQYYSTYNTPIQPAPAPAPVFGDLESHVSPTSPSDPLHLSSRNGESMTSSTLTTEDKSRLAAEEDKRRRNTAASARFRVKKKQREQALEKTVKEVSDKNSTLEAKVTQLEMENKWLKDLITEKNDMQSKEEMAAAYQKFRKESEEREVISSPHTTGVGTE